MVLQQDKQMKEIIRINCKNEINNAEIDNAKDIDILMPIYNLIEYSDNYSKKNLHVYGNITKMSQIITYQILNH